jgi:hypothetical protein
MTQCGKAADSRAALRVRLPNHYANQRRTDANHPNLRRGEVIMRLLCRMLSNG